MSASLPVTVRSAALVAATGLMISCVVGSRPAQLEPTTESETVNPAVQPAILIETADFDSAAHRNQLLTNFTHYALAYPGNPFGYVPTNTVALHEYALELLLTLANDVNRSFRIGLTPPVTADSVTRIGVLPKTNDFSAGLTILSRYQLGFAGGKLINYRDLDYWFNTYENKPEKFQARAKEKNLLNKTKALQIARDALHALGFSESQLRLPRRPEIEQVEYTDQRTGKVALFPH